MSLRTVLADAGGWLRRDELLSRGWSARQIRAAREAEGIPLVRRRWLLLPEADPALHAAAAAGAVVSCGSALVHHGLWVPPFEFPEPHYAVPPTWSERPDHGRTHHSRAPAPRDARSLFDPVANVLANVAVCMPAEHAFAVWESAIATGSATVRGLRRITWLHPAARRLAAEIGEGSDSGVESTFVWRCRRLGLRVVQQVRIAGRRVDALVADNVVAQIDGWAFHSDPAQRRQDIRHDRELATLGYVVLRFDYMDVMHDWPRVERELRRVIGRVTA